MVAGDNLLDNPEQEDMAGAVVDMAGMDTAVGDMAAGLRKAAALVALVEGVASQSRQQC